MDTEVIFSEHLTWNEHTEHIQSKVSSAVGIISRLRHILPVKVKILLYNSLVSSLLEYCCIVWCTTGVTNLKKLHMLQKRAVRCIANVPYLYPTSKLFLKYDILPVFCLFDYRIMMIYKCFLRYNENYSLSLAKLKENPCTRNTRFKDPWAVPTPRVYGYTQSLRYTVPVLINKLFKEDFDPLCASTTAIKCFCRDKLS